MGVIQGDTRSLGYCSGQKHEDARQAPYPSKSMGFHKLAAPLGV